MVYSECPAQRISVSLENELLFGNQNICREPQCQTLLYVDHGLNALPCYIWNPFCVLGAGHCARAKDAFQGKPEVEI